MGSLTLALLFVCGRRKIAGSLEPGAGNASHRDEDVRHQTIRRQTLAVSLRDIFINAAEPLPI